MAIDPGPHNINQTRPLFTPQGGVLLKQVTPSFYEDLGKDVPDFGGHILERDQVKWNPVNRPIARQTVMPNVNLGHDHVSMKNDHALGDRVEITLPA